MIFQFSFKCSWNGLEWLGDVGKLLFGSGGATNRKSAWCRARPERSKHPQPREVQAHENSRTRSFARFASATLEQCKFLAQSMRDRQYHHLVTASRNCLSHRPRPQQIWPWAHLALGPFGPWAHLGTGPILFYLGRARLGYVCLGTLLGPTSAQGPMA